MNLDKKLDVLHSIFTRLKSCDENGFCNCYTCNNDMTYYTAQNGHFIIRQNTQFRWSDINTKQQCDYCNFDLQGNVVVFEERLKEQYGIEKIDEIKQMSKVSFKMTKWEKEELLKLRRKQCRELLKSKNFTVTIP